MIKVVGDRNDDFVTRIGNGKDCIHEAHVGSGSDYDSFLGIELNLVVVCELGLDSFQKLRNALDQFVFVVVRVLSKGSDAIINSIWRAPGNHTLDASMLVT